MRYLLAAVLLIAMTAAGMWDVVMVAKGQPRDTVSSILHEWSLLYPILPLIIGLLLGHIFWPTETIRIVDANVVR